VGSRIPIEVIRGGRHITIPVTITQRPTEEELAKQLGQGTPGTDQSTGPTTSTGSTLGLSLQPLTPQIARALNLPAGTSGVVIASIDSSSDAAEKGLQRGDVILAVQGQRVTTPAQVVAAVEAAKRANRTSVLLLVKRGTAPEAFVGVDIRG
jgi:serine protease Do